MTRKRESKQKGLMGNPICVFPMDQIMAPISDVLGGSFEGFERWVLVKNEERLKLGIE